MRDYAKLEDDQKLELLNSHSIAGEWPSLDHTMWCLHCGKEFRGRDARVYTDDEGGLWLECGTPGCDGSPIDWAEYPWWDSEHPLTKARRQDDEEDGEDGYGETPPSASAGFH